SKVSSISRSSSSEWRGVRITGAGSASSRISAATQETSSSPAISRLEFRLWPPTGPELCIQCFRLIFVRPGKMARTNGPYKWPVQMACTNNPYKRRQDKTEIDGICNSKNYDLLPGESVP